MLRFFSCLLFVLLIACGRTTTIHPQRKSIIETVYASGKIIPENEYTIYSLSNGTVREKLVNEGDTVPKGTVLYEIKNESSQANLESAKANFENAKSNLSPQSRILSDLKISAENAQVKYANDSMQYIRYKNLYDQNATSKVSVDNAFTTLNLSLNQKKSAEEKYYSTVNELKLALERAKSQLAAAQSDLDNYFIKSEAEGMVFQTFKEKGETVRMGEMIALLGSGSKRIIKLAVDQQDIDKINTGQQVLLRTDVTGSTIYQGTVFKVYPVMQEIDQTYRVDAVFKDSIPLRFVHNSVEANIVIQQKDSTLTLPINAVFSDSVKIREGGKTKTIAVKTGIRTLEEIEITGGLDENSEVFMPQIK